MVPWKITLAKAEAFSPLLLALAFLASWARVAAIKLSWANSCTRKNHGVLLSVLSLEKKSFPESSASSWTNTKCSDGEPMPRREAVSHHTEKRELLPSTTSAVTFPATGLERPVDGYTNPISSDISSDHLSMPLKTDHHELIRTGISCHFKNLTRHWS